MSQRKTYLLLAKAVACYGIKEHIYMTAWIVTCMIYGVYDGVKTQSVNALIIAWITAFIPLIIKNLSTAILSIDRWDRQKIREKKERKRENFRKYIERYLEENIK